MLVVSLLLHAAPVSAGRASTGGAGRGAAAAGRGASMETGGTGSAPVTGGRHARIRRPCGARGARCVGGGSSLDANGFESESLLVVDATPGSAQVFLDGRLWEWQWQGDLQPLWWLLGVGGLGILIVVLALWALVSLAPVVLALVGAALGIRWLAGATRRSRPDRAVQILRERYARGEIG